MGTEKIKKRGERRTKKKGYYGVLIDQIKSNKFAAVVYFTLRLLVIATIVRCAFIGQYENCFIGVLALILFLIPPFIERQFKIELPTTLEVIAYVFVFCAEILGEIGCYYIKYPFWDSMLHTVNGFVFAAFGFCLIDMFNKSKRTRFSLSPFSLALVAFCFSMTIGVLWEFVEFGIDYFLDFDMQKDYIIRNIHTVALDSTASNTVVSINNIVNTVVTKADGSVYVIYGYLDIGLLDTMKDLLVNFAGAVVFSVIGYIYVKQRGKGKIASQFIPKFVGDEVPEGEIESKALTDEQN